MFVCDCSFRQLKWYRDILLPRQSLQNNAAKPPATKLIDDDRRHDPRRPASHLEAEPPL